MVFWYKKSIWYFLSVKNPQYKTLYIFGILKKFERFFKKMMQNIQNLHDQVNFLISMAR